MLTGTEQTWEYLKENYPDIYKIGITRNIVHDDCIGLGQFSWIQTDEGHDFWSDIYNRGNTDRFYARYPKTETISDSPIRLYPL